MQGILQSSEARQILVHGGTPDEAIHRYLMVIKSGFANKMLQCLRDEIVDIVGINRLKNLQLTIYVSNRNEYLKFMTGNNASILIINLVKGERPKIKWVQREKNTNDFPTVYANIFR